MARWGLVLIAGTCGCGGHAPQAAPDEQPVMLEPSTEPVPEPEAQPDPAEASPAVDPAAVPEPSAPTPPPGSAPEQADDSPPRPVVGSPVSRDPIAECREVVARGGSYADCIRERLDERWEGDRRPGRPGDYPPHVPTRQPARDERPYGPLDHDPRLD